MSTLLKIAFITFIACIGLLSLGHLLLEYNPVRESLQTLTTHYWSFALFRYILYGLVVVFWPKIIRKIGIKKQWNEGIIQVLSQQRIKVLSFFILIEIFFVYNLISRIIVWL